MADPTGLSLSPSQLISLATALGAYADYIVPVLIVAYTIWWAYTLRTGSKIHRGTLALHIGVYGVAALYVYMVSFSEFYAYGDTLQITGVAWMLGALAITYVAVRIGMWYGGRALLVVQSEAGAWHLRGPIEIALFWGSLYAARFLLETFLLQGYSVLFPIHPLPAGISVGVFTTVVVIVASLYLVSFGFLCGVSISEWNLHAEMLQTNAGTGAPPGPTAT